ncbi:MAG TPA: hypothetical protein VLH56_08550 [Dissulfurispiraceae bacterium]|nr:hypothetical protein [Dissulfurispiraceae bacterium]
MKQALIVIVLLVVVGCATTPEGWQSDMDRLYQSSYVAGQIHAAVLFRTGGREAVLDEIIQIGEWAQRESERIESYQLKVYVSENARGRIDGMMMFLEGIPNESN